MTEEVTISEHDARTAFVSRMKLLRRFFESPGQGQGCRDQPQRRLAVTDDAGQVVTERSICQQAGWFGGRFVTQPGPGPDTDARPEFPESF